VKASTVRRLDLMGLVVAFLALALAMAWAFPLTWSIATTMTLPGGEGGLIGALSVYAQVLFGSQIGLWYVNSLVTSASVTIGVLAISATCGYALSQLEFTGRRVLWFVILASFMIPVQALIVNHFLLMNQWKLINTWLGVILPQLIAPVAVIVYKQFFDSVPKEYREAALVDGARHWQILCGVYLPLNWGVTAALGIIVFIGAWNAFLWPFLAVTKPELMNVTVGATQIRGGIGELATAILTGLPVAVIYLIFQRRVTEAITLSAGIKG